MFTTVLKIVKNQVQNVIDSRAQGMVKELFEKMDKKEKPYAATHIGFGSALRDKNAKEL